MEQIKWFDRKFNFDNEQNIFPSILERLSGTPLRLEEKLKTIHSSILPVKINNSWSIKENIGHLIDVEPLWQGRLEDIKNGQLELRPADLQNTQTDLANHNDKPIEELLNSFKLIRQQTIDLIENIDEKIVFQAALHPRLKTPMRTMDLFLFVAEHDDHHLARITKIVKMIEMQNKNMANMSITIANVCDLKTIYDLYDMATVYQKTVFDKQWEGFEESLIQKEIDEKRLWKITIDAQIVCVFSLNFNDTLFWKEKDKEPSIYIHRIALHNAFRGQSIMKTIIEWAKVYCTDNAKQFIRMDTWGENSKLIDYYKKCGFEHIETINLDNTVGLPSHYKGKLALLEMIVDK